MSELKPCPFCGSEAKVVEVYDLYKVECTWDFCPTNALSGNEETAASSWNRRATDGD